MNTLILANAFSLNMLLEEYSGNVRVVSYTLEASIGTIIWADRLINAIGHESTDAIVRGLLWRDGNEYSDGSPKGVRVPKGERTTIKLEKGDHLLVAQYRGTRLEEGTTVLPDGAEISWALITIG